MNLWGMQTKNVQKCKSIQIKPAATMIVVNFKEKHTVNTFEFIRSTVLKNSFLIVLYVCVQYGSSVQNDQRCMYASVMSVSCQLS
jgi:hypothetical protein